MATDSAADPAVSASELDADSVLDLKADSVIAVDTDSVVAREHAGLPWVLSNKPSKNFFKNTSSEL